MCKYIYIYIPGTSGYAKLTLDLETTLIIDVSFVYRRFPEKNVVSDQGPCWKETAMISCDLLCT